MVFCKSAGKSENLSLLSSPRIPPQVRTGSIIEGWLVMDMLTACLTVVYTEETTLSHMHNHTPTLTSPPSADTHTEPG
jgi:hypothetical protein